MTPEQFDALLSGPVDASPELELHRIGRTFADHGNPKGKALGLRILALADALAHRLETDSASMLRNCGVDTNCGACMEVAFCGVTMLVHTCTATIPGDDARQRLAVAVRQRDIAYNALGEIDLTVRNAADNTKVSKADVAKTIGARVAKAKAAVQEQGRPPAPVGAAAAGPAPAPLPKPQRDPDFVPQYEGQCCSKAPKSTGSCVCRYVVQCSTHGAGKHVGNHE